MDNVLLDIRPKAAGRRAAPLVRIESRERLEGSTHNGRCLIQAGGALFAVASCPMSRGDTGRGGLFTGPAVPAGKGGARFLFRFPQERQAAEAIVPAMADPEQKVNVRRGIELLIKKAAVDPQFRQLLLEKRAEAAKTTRRTPDRRAASSTLTVPVQQAAWLSRGRSMLHCTEANAASWNTHRRREPPDRR